MKTERGRWTPWTKQDKSYTSRDPTGHLFKTFKKLNISSSILAPTLPLPGKLTSSRIDSSHHFTQFRVIFRRGASECTLDIGTYHRRENRLWLPCIKMFRTKLKALAVLLLFSSDRLVSSYDWSHCLPVPLQVVSLHGVSDPFLSHHGSVDLGSLNGLKNTPGFCEVCCED